MPATICLLTFPFLLFVLLFLPATKLSAQLASFNFSRNAAVVAGWTNAFGDPARNVVTANDPSGISISSIATANWSPTADGNGSSDGGGSAAGGFFPGSVMINHWYQFGPNAVYNSAKPQLSLTGLSPTRSYTIYMTGGYSLNVPGTFNLNPIEFRVSGAALYGPVNVNGNANTTAGATFFNVIPDATGSVKVYLNAGTGANCSSINGIRILQGAPTVGWQSVNGIVSDSLDNVAIGTNDSKGYKFAVNGNAIFTKITVKPYSAWPDYVFDKGYHLPELQQLQRYITRNRHLPGMIPSAEAVSRGIDVGETQTQLLKKVEELTLYVIRQNEALEKLQRKNRQLEKAINKLQQAQPTQPILKAKAGAK